jgi:hypothetical protein
MITSDGRAFPSMTNWTSSPVFIQLGIPLNLVTATDDDSLLREATSAMDQVAAQRDLHAVNVRIVERSPNWAFFWAEAIAI